VSNLITRGVRTHGGHRSKRFQDVRTCTEQLAEPLSAEDQTVQSMPDASPTKWHLAHTTWFFETFVLRPHAPGYGPFDPAYEYLFNSYYEAVGPRHPRPQRGMLTRPGLSESWPIAGMCRRRWRAARRRQPGHRRPVELGLHHEQQHQELILMDAKHLLVAQSAEARLSRRRPSHDAATPLAWRDFEGGLVEIGHDGEDFAFDNEGPRHRVWLEPFALASRPTNCGEYLAFIEDGGYRRPEFWLSAGWDCVNQRGWTAPLYWEQDGASWRVFTLSGLQPLDPAAPVCHVSGFEGRRLRQVGGQAPAARGGVGGGRLGARGYGHRLGMDRQSLRRLSRLSRAGRRDRRIQRQVHGQPDGAARRLLGDAAGHCAPTYRNFFPPDARWMFGGIRLAEDLR
jgi:ergothioneine biosynthesis protein EgtB